MSSDEYRQSDRVNFRVPIEASWVTHGGIDKKQHVETLLVSRNGGVIRLADKLGAGQELLLRRQGEGDLVRSARARVVAEIDKELDGFLYAFTFTEKHPDFWDIEFPSPLAGDEALARLLMECGFCQRKEVVYLNELELKSFESRKCIARVCRHCDAPAIWVEAQSEVVHQATLLTNPMEERVIPRRNRTRVKARVLACIRRRGFQEEVAVCEDLSKGGIAFRSRNEYPEGTRVEVAVPFTPGSGAIFVPIRIVFSRAIPSAGLFRHGASYIREAVAPVK
ncbi:MAG TPA: PilZ domain-containing protein [Candidatus Eremiobacteraceae bacterium]|nr:PilZ domain-containing protein [Candidatus Eremiobacteraceae bacterium]